MKKYRNAVPIPTYDGVIAIGSIWETKGKSYYCDGFGIKISNVESHPEIWEEVKEEKTESIDWHDLRFNNTIDNEERLDRVIRLLCRVYERLERVEK